MSEEAKYFVGSYLALAHEFGHAVMKRRVKKIDEMVELRPASWMVSLFENIYKNTLEVLIDREKYRCKECPLYIYLTTPTNRRSIFIDFEDLMADIIAAHIGGVNYIYSFIDFAYNMVSDPADQIPFLLRTISSYYYLKLNGFNIHNLGKRVTKIRVDAEKIREDCGHSCPLNADFSTCVAEICAIWAKNINEFNKDFGKFVFAGLEDYITNLPYQYNPFQGSIDTEEVFREENLEKIFTLIFPEEHLDELIPNEKSQLLSMILKEGCKFKIRVKEEKEIINALLEGKPIPEKDPRHILHSYYEAYKRSEGEERPHYAATIYSLAFNTYGKNRRQRE